MRVRIYKPAKTALQSGQRNTKEWLLESEPAPKEIDPLMGWTSSRDTMQQVKLQFATLQEARAYAEKNGWHSLQISRRTSSLVERVSKVLPQAQTTVTMLSCGWMSFFTFLILVSPGRIPEWVSVSKNPKE